MATATTTYYVPPSDLSDCAGTVLADDPDLELRPKPRRQIANRQAVTTTAYGKVGAESVYEKHRIKLAELERNPALWVEDSEAPSSLVIAIASGVVEYLERIDFQPDKITASAEGGIAICFTRRTHYADLEFLNTGEILGVISDRKSRPSAWEVTRSPAGIAEAVRRIQEFIQG